MKLLLPTLCLFLSLFLWSGVSFSEEAGEELAPAEVPFRSVNELTFLQTGDPLVDWSSSRNWTSAEGKSLNAKILGVNEDQISLQLENAKITTLPASRLVEEDQRFIGEWLAVSEYFNPGYEAPRSLTNTIEAGIFDGAFAKEGKVHETRNFRFECDAVLTQEVVRDFSRLFEVTYLAVQAHPLGLAIAKPGDGKFNVRLFSNDQDYLAAGGSSDAAGVYRIKERIMLVPLSSLGLTPGSSGYKKTLDFDPRTLIHETTHALTHQWLAQAPMWFVEGFAEYISAIPYSDGKLYLARHPQGLLELTSKKFGGDPARFPLIDPAEFTAIDHRAFMGEPEVVENPIQLPRVEPFQIAYISKSADATTPSAEAPGENSSESPLLPEPGEPVMKPVFPGIVPQQAPSGPIVVQRYISSMALVHHLISSGQTGNLRRYLFEFARFEWDLNLYLDRFEKTHKEHHAAVEDQIEAFNGTLREFNAAVDEYNADVDRYNRRELTTAPVLPTEPVIPEPIPVPAILSNPRSPEALSRNEFLRNAWDKYLPKDPAISIDSLR
jgi:hypothetical protein